MNHFRDNAINDIQVKLDSWEGILDQSRDYIINDLWQLVYFINDENYRSKLIQVAAVAVAAVENYDRDQSRIAR